MFLFCKENFFLASNPGCLQDGCNLLDRNTTWVIYIDCIHSSRHFCSYFWASKTSNKLKSSTCGIRDTVLYRIRQIISVSEGGLCFVMEYLNIYIFFPDLSLNVCLPSPLSPSSPLYPLLLSLFWRLEKLTLLVLCLEPKYATV